MCTICHEHEFVSPNALCTPCGQCKTMHVCRDCLHQYLRTGLETEMTETPHQCGFLRAADKQFVVGLCPCCKDPIFIREEAHTDSFPSQLQQQVQKYSNMQKHGLVMGVVVASSCGFATGLFVGGVFGLCGGVLTTGTIGTAGWLYLKLRKPS